ncbi:class I SAM-dependent methyltransferase [Pseudalkalibacillus sp. JSM 102089]|uniref:class I SAM-dependent methyltransferase n=1 Tax=Pseudalkalibacillus sp. JSM 102089 TaxID=3229856 RepID=UPI0035244590
MIFTTAGRPTEALIKEAIKLSHNYEGTYISREKRSIQQIIHLYQEIVVVVGFDRLYLYKESAETPIFFHPNSAMFRCKAVLNGRDDAFIKASGLSEGMSLLDCTAGLGSDSIVASLIVGEFGSVQAIEGSEHALLLQEGLKKWESNNNYVDKAMRRITVRSNKYEDVLPHLMENSVDVVYFDPMFEDSILASDGISGIKQVAIYDALTENMVMEARRVARIRVILKDSFKSSRFEQLGFQQQIRKTSKFHYGILECKE